MNRSKKRIVTIVDKLGVELVALSHSIHGKPEPSFEEYFACDALATFLARHGFEVKTGIGSLQTAFIAECKGSENGPHIAFLAEYDALPVIGHGCGHNLISAMSAGAGIALSSFVGELGGKVSVIGTPGEETRGGKIGLLEEGVFDGVDFALMVHPTSGPNMIMRSARACTSLFVNFRGVSAHSSKPERGINALSAVMSTFQNIDTLRSVFEPQDNANGIVTNGGGASNVIPDYAACEFCLRSQTLRNLEQLIEKIQRCVSAAELLTGAKAEIRVDPLFAERYPNRVMGELFRDNLEILGETAVYPDPNTFYGSSDIGNVSLRLPTIHEYLSIAPGTVNTHSTAFAEAAVSLRADEVCQLGAKSLAMTGYDLLSSEKLRKEARASFESQVPGCYREPA